MKISSDSVAIAGEPFNFVVEGQPAGSFTKMIVRIGGNTVYSDDCDDPPCHETFVVPGNARGKHLLIEARSANGESAKAVVEVSESDSNTGAMTAA